MSTTVGRVIHSAEGIYSLPVPTRISHQTPFVVGGSPATFTGSLAAPSTSGTQPSRPLAEPRITGRDSRRLFPETTRDRMYWSRVAADRVLCRDAFQTNSVHVSNTSRPLIQSLSVGRTLSTQVTADSNSATSLNDIAKLNAVSRAVYDNFIGRLRTTAKPKTGTDRRLGPVTDVKLLCWK